MLIAIAIKQFSWVLSSSYCRYITLHDIHRIGFNLIKLTKNFRLKSPINLLHTVLNPFMYDSRTKNTRIGINIGRNSPLITGFRSFRDVKNL